MNVRAKLRRWHMWLGWLVGIPMLLWTVSGFVMVAKPISEVRGTALLRPLAPIASTAGIVTPRIDARAVAAMSLEPRAAGPRWVIHFADEPAASRLADPATGALLPAIGAAEAAREVAARFTGTAHVARVVRVDPNHPPIDLRRPLVGWQVAMSDGTHFYVDAGSGEVVARRTRFWRFYDLMWGIHIMDLQGRENTHNPWIVTFVLLSLAMVLMALVLLPLATRRGSRVSPPATATTLPRRD